MTVAHLTLEAIVAFHLLESLWELYIYYRQVSEQKIANHIPRQVLNSFPSLQSTVIKKYAHVPSVLEGVITPATFEKARAYNLEKVHFGLFKMVILVLIVSTVEIYAGLLPVVWSLSKELVRAVGLDAGNEYYVSCALVFCASLYGSVKDYPFELYSTFVVEQRHGFNKQTIGFFVKDHIKAFAVSQALSLPITCAVIYIVRIGGPHFYVWLWLFCGLLSLVLLTVYPIFIAPLFDKYSPLEDGPLRTAIEALAGQLRFPLKQLYVVDGSKRSAHSNAYFYGLWNSKRIVLFDTLLANYKPQPDENDETVQKSDDEEPLLETGNETTTSSPDEEAKPIAGCQNDEVIAVLAHELGHWKLGHVTKNICIGQLHMLLIFAAFGFLFNNALLYRMFGFVTDERPIIVGLILICNYILSAYNALISFAVTVLSRRFEYEADAFAVQLGHAEPLGRALKKLNADNLGFPVYDWLYSAWNHSHPSLLHRLARLSDGEEPKETPEAGAKKSN